ncbi:MAG TPA: hypothetical protein VFB96_07450, partial [Pirellulaceae bacterium]|nr:hypothetical protein [Pirellulaceae bacterium]
MNTMFLKIPVLIMLATLGFATDAWLTSAERPQVMNAALEQLHGGSEQTVNIEQSHQLRSLRRVGIAGVAILCGLALFATEISMFTKRFQIQPRALKAAPLLMALAVFPLAGCWRPFEPIQLETISPNEEAFLLPLTDDVKKQTSTNNEEYLKENLVYTKQVRIPQQWVQKGYETLGPNGTWKPAAILVKVD